MLLWKLGNLTHINDYFNNNNQVIIVFWKMTTIYGIQHFGVALFISELLFQNMSPCIPDWQTQLWSTIVKIVHKCDITESQTVRHTFQTPKNKIFLPIYKWYPMLLVTYFLSLVIIYYNCFNMSFSSSNHEESLTNMPIYFITFGGPPIIVTPTSKLIWLVVFNYVLWLLDVL